MVIYLLWAIPEICLTTLLREHEPTISVMLRTTSDLFTDFLCFGK